MQKKTLFVPKTFFSGSQRGPLAWPRSGSPPSTSRLHAAPKILPRDFPPCWAFSPQGQARCARIPPPQKPQHNRRELDKAIGCDGNCRVPSSDIPQGNPKASRRRGVKLPELSHASRPLQTFHPLHSERNENFRAWGFVGSLRRSTGDAGI